MHTVAFCTKLERAVNVFWLEMHCASVTIFISTKVSVVNIGGD